MLEVRFSSKSLYLAVSVSNSFNFLSLSSRSLAICSSLSLVLDRVSVKLASSDLTISSNLAFSLAIEFFSAILEVKFSSKALSFSISLVKFSSNDLYFTVKFSNSFNFSSLALISLRSLAICLSSS